MEIFGKHLFGSDAEWFKGACKKIQKKWILENTTQKNDELINEFLNSKMNEGKEECLGCKKENNGGNISEGNGKTTEPIESADTSRDSTGYSTKRPKRVKN